FTNLADQGWDVAIADDPVKGVSIDVQPVPSDTDLQAELAKVGLPENASLADLIQHHRANAGVAAALDSLRTSQPVQVKVTNELVNRLLFKYDNDSTFWVREFRSALSTALVGGK